VLFNIWLIIIGLMLVSGVILRIWQRNLPPVQLHKVSPKAAAQLVGEFIVSSYDGQFGYPSGLFRIEQSDETQIVAREVVGRGSHFTQIVKGLFKAILSVGAGFGCLGSYLAFCLAAILTPMLLYAALTELVLKNLLRSQIVATLERAQDGTKVAFTLRGPAALLVGRRLERAFHAPVLPARVAALAGVPVPQAGGGISPTAAAGTPAETAADPADGTAADPIGAS
jgi:hypothetical protein